MTLGDLKQRCDQASRRHKLTLAGFLSEHRIAARTFHAAATGQPIDLATAVRLLPLVTSLIQPGEVAALECELPTGLFVVLSPETFAELRARFFHHQPN